MMEKTWNSGRYIFGVKINTSFLWFNQEAQGKPINHTNSFLYKLALL